MSDTTMEVCMICGGNGLAVRHSGVDPFNMNKVETCWLCGGKGKVLKQQWGQNIHIHKYYLYGGQNGGETEGQVGGGCDQEARSVESQS